MDQGGRMNNKHVEKCPRCGEVLKCYKFYITKNYWVCCKCAKDVELHG